MKNINLSYVITTRNKLPYLKNVLSLLIENIKADEEIVVVDANSTDGTKDYLEKLFREGKIHQYLSEKDYSESHGWNKTWLMAKGTLIKIVTDDDVYFYPEIQKCKEFMLKHYEIDFLGTEGLFDKSVHESSFIGSKLYSGNRDSKASNYLPHYMKWKEEGVPFSFCNLGWVLRKSSMPIFGLCDPKFIRLDAEFTIRLTSGFANVAWYTGKTWCRVLNPNSNSVVLDEKIRIEDDKMNMMYPDSNWVETPLHKKWYQFLPRNIKTPLKEFRNNIFARKKNDSSYIPTESDWKNIYDLKNAELKKVNEKEPGKFFHKDPK